MGASADIESDWGGMGLTAPHKKASGSVILYSLVWSTNPLIKTIYSSKTLVRHKTCYSD